MRSSATAALFDEKFIIYAIKLIGLENYPRFESRRGFKRTAPAAISPALYFSIRRPPEIVTNKLFVRETVLMYILLHPVVGGSANDKSASISISQIRRCAKNQTTRSGSPNPDVFWSLKILFLN